MKLFLAVVILTALILFLGSRLWAHPSISRRLITGGTESTVRTAAEEAAEQTGKWIAEEEIPKLIQGINAVSAKNIMAGGVAVGTVVAAHEVADGVQTGLVTVAEKNPQAFSDSLSVLMAPLRYLFYAAILLAAFWLYRLWRKWKKSKNEP